MDGIWNSVATFCLYFWKYLELASPYLLLGLLVSGALHQFLPTSLIKRWMGGGKVSSVFRASLVGVPLPLCSCSVVPTAITLRQSGASKSSTSAFLISTPETGIDSVMMTYGVMDIPMTLIRPVVAFVSASVAGLANLYWERGVGDQGSTSPAKQENHDHIHGHHHDAVAVEGSGWAAQFKKMLKYGFVDLLDDMVGWLLFGLVCGALISWVVPDDFFAQLNPTVSKVVLTALATVLYICASASTPVAASLIAKGMSPGTALIFLLLGPATNISNLLILQKYLGWRTLLTNLVTIIVLSLGFSYAVDWGYEHWWNVAQMKIFQQMSSHHMHDHGQDHNSWISFLSAVVLGLLMSMSLWREHILPFYRKRTTKKTCCHHHPK